FFFQAEDGIRVFHVTGVQTCALPILGAAFIGALINLVFGFIVAWVLVRYQFFGKKIVDALVDLPFALPTAVAGIALTSLYAPQGIGRASGREGSATREGIIAR